jgi:intron-binding protein aquarius
MYMRLLGYPAEKISIITTYNGQKHLIRDVLNARCAWDPRLGLPAKVTTVDRYCIAGGRCPLLACRAVQ